MKVLKLLVAVGMVVPACGGFEPAATTTSTTQQPTTTTTSNPTTTTSSTLPGEVSDFGPAEGDTLMVIGVQYDDVLNVRAAPGVDYEIVATLAPTEMDVAAAGETRQIPGASWIAIDVDGVFGWVNMRYVGYQGATDDLTSQVVAGFGGIPTASTMVDLGLLVAGTMASEEPPSEIVLVIDETAGDVGEVTFDIIGLGDDAVRGLRVHVFGQPAADGFSLMSVEVTTICGRGITSDGLCP